MREVGEIAVVEVPKIKPQPLSQLPMVQPLPEQKDGKGPAPMRAREQPTGEHKTAPQSPKSKIIQKSPQELAAQMGDVRVGSYQIEEFPAGQAIIERFDRQRARLEELQEQGVGDEELSEELTRMYEEGRDLGLYTPDQGAYSEKLIDELSRENRRYGYSEEEARSKAIRTLKGEGYLAELRDVRKRYEEEIARAFEQFDSSHPLDPQEEKRRIAELGQRCYLMLSPEQMEVLARDFPGGNFLYHGTNVEQAISIQDEGGLVNSETLIRREKEKGFVFVDPQNSGYEGISWSYNEIGALPGDRYHLVGFLTSPNAVLNGDLQLAIPSRPTPHEVILINGDIESRKFYVLKTQSEMLDGRGNSVRESIAEFEWYKKSPGQREYSEGYPLNQFFKASSNLTDEQIEAILRPMYKIRGDGTIEFSTDLFRQARVEIPVAAVWFQAMIDSGRINNVENFENVTSVKQAIDRIEEGSLEKLMPELKKDIGYIDSQLVAEREKVKPISIPTSEMYFVVPSQDLYKWLQVLARCKILPKGIVIYDHNKIRLENFDSRHRGDNEALTEELRRAIPKSEGYIDYESQFLGEEITPEKLRGYRHSIVAEKFLGKRKTLRKNDHGEVVLV